VVLAAPGSWVRRVLAVTELDVTLVAVSSVENAVELILSPIAGRSTRLRALPGTRACHGALRRYRAVRYPGAPA